MNTANLQLEGLCMAVAALVELLKEKRLVTADEVEVALARAERSVFAGKEELPPANMEAVAFPIRLLKLANASSEGGVLPPFSALARRIGEAKDRRAALNEDELLRLATILEHERDA